MARTERKSERRREDQRQTVGAAEISKELAEWRRLQRKNLSILVLLKRTEWLQCHRESSSQVRQSPLCQKEKEDKRKPHLDVREMKIRMRAWTGKGGLHSEGRQVPRRRLREGKQEELL